MPNNKLCLSKLNKTEKFKLYKINYETKTVNGTSEQETAASELKTFLLNPGRIIKFKVYSTNRRRNNTRCF